MKIFRNASPCIAIIATTLAVVACRPTTERRRVDFERMRQQQRYDDYGESRFFRDGMAMRTPPAGTISREELDLGEAATTGKTNGAYVARVPIAITPDLLVEGAQSFGIYCAVCHGEDASGRSVVGSNMRPVHPPSLLTSSAGSLSPGELFEVITGGRGRMPAYAWAIPPAERWAVIAYLARLKESGQ